MTTLRRSAIFLLVCAAVLLLGRVTYAAPQQPSQVVLLRVHDTIQPISEQYISRGIARAADIHADAVLIELDTPGGLLDSTRDIVHDILASPSPVIVYVAPSGSRAGSAGFFILESADIAAMAPGTNAGAAHPSRRRRYQCRCCDEAEARK